MKYRQLPENLKILFAAVVLVIAAFNAFGQETQPWSQNTSPLPPPTGFVNDYAGVIDPATMQRLETRLKEFRDKTDPSVEIAVAVVKTTGERPIFDYSLAVARGWKIGSKQDDNPSALLFVAIDDRKYFTQVSKDLEDELPDGAVGSLQRQFLVPEFKKGNYSKGIEDTINAFISTIENKGNVPANKPAQPSSGSTGLSGGIYSLFCCAVIIVIILLMIFSRKGGGPTKSDRSRWGGGGFGSGGSSRDDILPAVIGGIIGSALSGGSSSSTSSSDWGSSSGGSDFGGFSGGGDFGGGGSGGDW